MTVKYRNKATGEVTEGMLVTGAQNDTVGLVVWAGAHKVNLNQTFRTLEGGVRQFVPIVRQRIGEPIEIPVGSLLTIEPEGQLNVLLPDRLSEYYEEVH